MKSKITVILAICITALISLPASAAKSKSDALNGCKDHIESLYQGEARTKIKKMRKRSGDFEVQMRVKLGGETFNAVCTFADDEMTYTTDQNDSAT